MMTKIGDRIKEVRVKNELSHDKFGFIVGVTQGAVWSWEHGFTEIKMHNAITICKKFKVSMDWLCGLTDESFIPPYNMNNKETK